jgi:hypothetical protein
MTFFSKSNYNVVEIITTLTYICIVNNFYFIVVMAKNCTFFNSTQQDAKHKDRS